MKRNWTDILRDKINRQEEPCPERLWDEVAAGMTLPSHKSGARWLAPALATAAACICALMLLPRADSFSSTAPNASFTEASLQRIDDTYASLSVVRPEIAHPASQAESRPPHKPSELVRTHEAQEKEAAVSASDVMSEQVMSDDLLLDDAQSAQMPVKQEIYAFASDNKIIPESYQEWPEEDESVRHNRHHEVTMRAGMSGSGAMSFNAAAGSLAMTTNLLLSDAASCSSQYCSAEYVGSNMSSPYKYAARPSEVRHAMPVKAGVSASIALTDRLAVGTGVEWIMLNSRLEKNEGSLKTAQALHYVGVPVTLTCNLISYDHLALYAGGGVEAAKNVAGKAVYDSFIGGSKVGSSTVSLRDERMRFAALIDAGLVYDIAPHVGLYLEPALSYHFSSGDEALSIIWIDRPLDFSLSAGLRFNLGR